MTITKTTRPAQAYLGFTKECAINDLIKEFDGVYETIGEHLRKHGIKPTGMPVAIYKAWDFAAGRCTFMPAFPVAADTDPKDMELYVQESGDAYVALYEGSYKHLNVPHGQMMAHAKEQGDEETLVMEEYTVGPPSGLPEEQYQTTLIHYIK